VEMLWQAEAVPPHLVMTADRLSRVAMGWTMTLALFRIADRWWNGDHRWRATLGEAVFPAYLVHHCLIVLASWHTLPLALDPWTEFAILLAVTTGGCAAFYVVGRRVGWLRPLIGLRARGKRAPTLREPAGAGMA
jgi:glucan biosynthesis protein C